MTHAPRATAVELGRPLVRLGEVGSTNDVVRHMAHAGVRDGAVVVAERQSAGRGRLGRAWASPRGGLWMSALLRAGGEPLRAGGFSLAAGVAVADAIAGLTGLHPRLKWPNDVLLGGRKVAGILIESAGTALIVGIGVNVAISLGDLPPEAAARATSLDAEAARAFDPGEVLPVVLDRLSRWYGAWRDGDGIVQAWRAWDAMLGAPLRVTVAGQTLEGLGDGVDDDGALRLRLDAGGTRRVLAGDVEVVVRSDAGV